MGGTLKQGFFGGLEDFGDFMKRLQGAAEGLYRASSKDRVQPTCLHLYGKVHGSSL